MKRIPILLATILAIGLYHGARSALEDWSTSAGSNNSASPNGFPENMAPSGVNDSARELMAQVRRYAQQSVSAMFAPDAGSANAYVINPSIAPAGYISGQVFRFKAGAANTGSASLNVSSLGAITIYKITNTALSSGDIKAGQMISVVYDGSAFQMQTAPALGALATLDTIAAAQISTNAVTFAAIAQGPTGALITFGTDRNATYITPGASGQVLTSRGATSTAVWQTSTNAITISSAVIPPNIVTAPGNLTTPSTSEGMSAFKIWVTPQGSGSKIKLDASLNVKDGAGGAWSGQAVLFRGATPLVAWEFTGGGQTQMLNIIYVDSPGITTATQYELRVGHNTGSTLSVNASAIGGYTQNSRVIVTDHGQ